MSRSKYFTAAEVGAHNTASDLWVSVLGRVLDLTPLVQKHTGDALVLPILESAGKDISSWFDPETKDVLRFLDPVTHTERYYTPRGRFVDVPPSGPRSDWASDGAPWWRDLRYEVGLLSARTRWIRVINTLTGQETPLQVCSEETLEEIQDRYLSYNSHAHSYTWTHGGGALTMDRTLHDNGLHDDNDPASLRLDPAHLTPAILLHFNDDLTEA